MMDDIILNALKEDIGAGDYSTLSCVPETAQGSAELLVKENGILAGVEVAKRILFLFDATLQMKQVLADGDAVKKGDIAFYVTGSSRSILTVERTLLNVMQRMSGIATQTSEIVQSVSACNVKILDTRKTTPGFRLFEKMAVKIGGGENHRFGLYDMIMLKDNHIDYAGGIEAAILATHEYLKIKDLNLKLEIEVRNRTELEEVLRVGKVDRIMLDNFSPNQLIEVLQIIPSSFETEASGGITKENVLDYAKTGVNYISLGALTHSAKSLDLSLKAIF
jgi:nicotinate-nucleotide pyrophosphorylase (carboxylating)